MDHDHEISLDIPATPIATRTARQVVDGLPLDDHLEAHFNLRLLISELVGNSVRHADVSPRGSVTIEVALDDDRVRVVVADPWHGLAAPLFADGPQPTGTSGRGLLLVEALADRWGTARADGRSTVWFEIDL